MKIVFNEKKAPAVRELRSLLTGTIFVLYNERDKNQEDRDYYIVVGHNGHREFYNLRDGCFRPLNADCLVFVVDCALQVYGIKD